MPASIDYSVEDRIVVNLAQKTFLNIVVDHFHPTLITRLFPFLYIEKLVKVGLFQADDRIRYEQMVSTAGNINDPHLRQQIMEQHNCYLLKEITNKIYDNPRNMERFLYSLIPDQADVLHAIMDVIRMEEEKNNTASQNCTVDHARASNDVSSQNVSNNAQNARQDNLACLVNLPEQIAYAIKRENKYYEIAHHLTDLIQQKQGCLIIHGMGGSGKTVLAADSIRTFHEAKPEAFRDGIFWLNIGVPERSNDGSESNFIHFKLDVLLEAVNLRNNNGSSTAARTSSIESAQNQLNAHFARYTDSLLVLDDVWSKEIVTKFRFNVPVVLTARSSDIVPREYRQASVSTDCTKSVQDGILSHEDAVKLFHNYLKQNKRFEGREDIEEHLVNNDYLRRILEHYQSLPFCIPHIAMLMEPYFEDVLDSPGPDNELLLQNKWQEVHRLLVHNESCKDKTHFENLASKSIEALSSDERSRLLDFGIFCEEVCIKVLETMWKDENEAGMRQCLRQLICKSLVIKNVNTNMCEGKMVSYSTYTVHSITKKLLIDTLKKQGKLQAAHQRLLNNYFERYCREANNNNNNLDYSRLPNDQYIYHYLAHHIQSCRQYSLFPQIFFNFSFLANKIRYVGPGDLDSDYAFYGKHFGEKHAKKLAAFQTFISTNASTFCEKNADIIQVALFEKEDSLVCMAARQTSNDKAYFEWTNKTITYIERIPSHSFMVTNSSDSQKAEIVNCAVICPTLHDLVMAVVRGKQLEIFVHGRNNPISSFTAHTDTINFCIFSRDGAHILTSSDDGKTNMWRNPVAADAARYGTSKTGWFVGDDKVDHAEARFVALTPPSKRRTNSGNTSNPIKSFFCMNKVKKDARIELLEPESLKHKCCDMSPGNAFVVVGSNDGIVRIFSCQNQQEIQKLNCQADNMGSEVESCAFSDDGRFLLSLVCTTVHIFRCGSVEASRMNAVPYRKLEHSLKMHNAVFMPGDQNDTVIIFTSCGKEIIEWEIEEKSSLTGDTDRQLVTRCYDLRNSADVQMTPSMNQQYYFELCAVSPNGDKIGAYERTRDKIFLWNHGSSDYFLLHTCSDEVKSLSFSPSSQQLLIARASGELIVLDIQKGMTIKPQNICLNPNIAVSYNVDEKDGQVKLNVLGIDNDGLLRLFRSHKGIESVEFHAQLSQSLEAYQAQNGAQAKLCITCCDMAKDGAIVFGTNMGEHFFYCPVQPNLIKLDTDDNDKSCKEVVHCEFFPETANASSSSTDTSIRLIFADETSISFYLLDLKDIENTKKEIYKLDQSKIRETIRDMTTESRFPTSPVQTGKFKLDSFINYPLVGCIILWSVDGSLIIQDYQRKNVVYYESNHKGKITSVDVNTRDSLQSCMAVARSDAKTIDIYQFDGKSIVQAKGDRNSPPPAPHHCVIRLPRIKTSDCPRCCRISSGKKFMVYGQDDGSLVMLDFVGERKLQKLWNIVRAHDSWVRDIAISPDESFIVSASKTIKLLSRSGTLLQYSAMRDFGNIERLFIKWGNVLFYPNQSTSSNHLSRGVQSLSLENGSGRGRLPSGLTIVLVSDVRHSLLIFGYNMPETQ